MCINTIANLVGEIQRAGKTPIEFAEIVASRVQDAASAGIQAKASDKRNPRQGRPANAPYFILKIDFDLDVALLFSQPTMTLLEQRIWRSHRRRCRTDSTCSRFFAEVWIKQRVSRGFATTQLLVLDGFFDFTPGQGEMLKLLIPQYSGSARRT